MRSREIIVLSSFLFLVLFLSIGITTANENNTLDNDMLNTNEEITVDDVIKEYDTLTDYDDYNEYESDSINENYNAKIIAEDLTLEYTDDDYQLSIYIVDNDNNPIEDADPLFDGYLTSLYSSDEGYTFYPMYLDAGKHKVEFTLDDGIYKAEPVTINLNIVKSVFYGDVKCKSYYGTDKSTLIMKATVYNPYQGYYEDGYVTFKVNGKSYKVKTKNGVATKKIKLKKAKTYTYTATFSNENYKSSVKGKAKLYVYSTSKKARTFKIKSYKVVVPIAKYKKLVNAKNTGKPYYVDIKTKKYFKQKVGNSKKKLKTVKARVIFSITYGGKTGGQLGTPNKYYMYLTTPYENPGWEYCIPWITGAKKSSVINKLNSAKTTKW